MERWMVHSTHSLHSISTTGFMGFTGFFEYLDLVYWGWLFHSLRISLGFALKQDQVRITSSCFI